MPAYRAAVEAEGMAKAPSLAEFVMHGMWFFLGVAVGRAGIRPQRVDLLKLAVDGQRVFAIVISPDRRLLAASADDNSVLFDWLRSLNIEVEWTKGADLAH